MAALWPVRGTPANRRIAHPGEGPNSNTTEWTKSTWRDREIIIVSIRLNVRNDRTISESNVRRGDTGYFAMVLEILCQAPAGADDTAAYRLGSFSVRVSFADRYVEESPILLRR